MNWSVESKYKLKCIGLFKQQLFVHCGSFPCNSIIFPLAAGAEYSCILDDNDGDDYSVETESTCENFDDEHSHEGASLLGIY